MIRLIGWFMLLVFWTGGVWGVEAMFDRENLSIKAGPTEPGENIYLVWVEAFIYPKLVREERVLSLGVRTASKVKNVSASFDFKSKPVVLSGADGLSWGGAYKIPEGVTDGVHVVRYQIAGQRGSIQRTVEFFLESHASALKPLPQVSRGEVFQSSGWPLTVLASCTAFSGNSIRTLSPGQFLVGLSKMPWYKVVFEDGKEGWVSAANVKEPTNDYYNLGYRAYSAKNFSAAVKYYRDAVTIDPGFVKGYFWLAKSYAAQDNLDAAAEEIKKALRLDERDLECRVIADMLAQQFYSQGHKKFKQQRYHSAVAAYRQALDLKPSSVLSWVEMGAALQRLGLNSEARSAWKEGLKYDPENQSLRASVGLAADKTVETPAGGKPALAVLVVDDSLRLIKGEKTTKGTKIETAIKSVVSLTKSLGTAIIEKGWQVKKEGEKTLVSYLCEQSGGAKETFDWVVDVDTRQVTPHNDNARLLMSRW
jgi:tetratricopeptide (TPR) repeat protein